MTLKLIYVIYVNDSGRIPLVLSDEWESFRDLLLESDSDFALISCHPCLWAFKNRLNFYRQLDEGCHPHKSKKQTRELVEKTLSSMLIFTKSWAKKIYSWISIL